MKLLFLTGSLVHGGAERHTITLANGLAARGHECHAAYIKDDPSQLERLRGAASVRCLNARRYLDPMALHRLAEHIRRLRPSAVVAVNAYALLYAALALRFAGTGAPLAVTYHTTLLRNLKERLQMLYYRPFFWRAERLIFVCEAPRRYRARRQVRGRVTEVIHNGVDLQHWRPQPADDGARLRRVLGIADGDYVLGMSAVLRAEKNPLQLVEALAQLRQRGVPARALFIGDGPMRPALEARARALGVAAQVTVTGLQQDVRPLLGACDVLTLCSTAVETFSLAALEAMALARPVVHSEVGGAAEMIRDGEQGFLFPANDTAALVERLHALADPALRARLGEKACATVAARFSEQAMLDKYETLFKELTKARTRHDNNLSRPASAH